LFFAVDQSIDVVSGQLEAMAMGDRIGGASFNAITAKDATRIVNVVHASVPFSSGDTLIFGVFGGFNINAVRRAGCGAKKTSYALFKTLLITLKNMNPPVARLEMDRLGRVIFSDGLTEHVRESDAEAADERDERFAHITKDGWHMNSL